MGAVAFLNMSTHIDATLRDRLTPDFAAMLAGSPPVPDDPAELEHLAAGARAAAETRPDWHGHG